MTKLSRPFLWVLVLAEVGNYHSTANVERGGYCDRTSVLLFLSRRGRQSKTMLMVFVDHVDRLASCNGYNTVGRSLTKTNQSPKGTTMQQGWRSVHLKENCWFCLPVRILGPKITIAHPRKGYRTTDANRFFYRGWLINSLSILW